MKKLLTVCILAVSLSSCGDNATKKETWTYNSTEEVPNKNESKLEKMSWVLGAWANETPEGVFVEYWEKTNDTLYTGHGMLLSAKGDTLFSEEIKMEHSGNTLYYKPVVSDQNDGKETVFTEKSLTENQIVFENPAHDFPQRVIYKKLTDSTLHAIVEGKVNGQDRQQDFVFKKIKPAVL